MTGIADNNKPYPAQQWRMPPLSTVWVCDDAVQRTLGEMISGMGDGFVPRSDEDVLMVLDRYGCDWTSKLITYSFMQRDEAVAALDDPDRYSYVTKHDATYKGVRWVYDDLVNATVSEFVMRHLPDVHDWEGGTYNVTSLDGNDGRAYRVEIDIPTSGYECWIGFDIAIPTYETEPMALFIQGIRSGAHGDEETTFVCEGLDGEWKESEPEEDD